LATSNEKPGFARLFHFPLSSNLLISIPVLEYEQACPTDPWNPAGSIHHNQTNELKGYSRRVLS
jgi:hypothetical protein